MVCWGGVGKLPFNNDLLAVLDPNHISDIQKDLSLTCEEMLVNV